jgi:hypothetical protein
MRVEPKKTAPPAHRRMAAAARAHATAAHAPPGDDRRDHLQGETGMRRPDLDARAAVAEALGIEVVDLLRHPDQPSVDALLRRQPADVWQQHWA